MFPNSARLRNLTYASPLYVDLTKNTLDAEGNVLDAERVDKVFIGKVPIMLHTRTCHLWQASERELAELGEVRNSPSGPLPPHYSLSLLLFTVWPDVQRTVHHGFDSCFRP